MLRLEGIKSGVTIGSTMQLLCKIGFTTSPLWNTAALRKWWEQVQ
jgi:hypothetical protein